MRGIVVQVIVAAVGTLEEAGVTSEAAGAISEATGAIPEVTGEAGAVGIPDADPVLLDCLVLYIKGCSSHKPASRAAGQAGVVCTLAAHCMLCMCSCSVFYIKLHLTQGLSTVRGCQHFC